MDEQIWFYIAAAVIYFLTRKKKKPVDKPSSPNTASSGTPTPERKPVSFEDLLKEITDQREVEEEPVYEEREPEPEPVKENFSNEGRNRQFADEESKRIYEEGIRQAEGAEIEFAPAAKFENDRLFKGGTTESNEPTLADEIREGLANPESARKAIIYSEILQPKY